MNNYEKDYSRQANEQYNQSVNNGYYNVDNTDNVNKLNSNINNMNGLNIPLMQIEDEENYDGLLKLFVGGLNYLSLQSDIKSYFETFGKVNNCTLLIDKGSGKSRGFAFVTIEDPLGELKDKVLTRKHEINGKIVDVKLAVEGKKREEMLDSSKKIFVGGLDPTVANDDLRNFFQLYGDVREAVVLFDNNRGASRCFGFVTFDSKETVDLLVKDNNYVIKGKPVDVKQALPKALQKAQNITCQSGVDMVLGNNRNKNIKNKRPDEMENNETNDLEDRNFVDMITNPYFNSKEYYQKFSDNETTRQIGNNNPDPQMFNFNPYGFYDPNSMKENKKSNKKK